LSGAEDAPIFQVADITTSVIEALAQQFSNASPCFCALLRSHVSGVLPAHLVNQIAHAGLVLKQMEESRVYRFKCFLNLA
jgi:hypothetical protein